MFSSVSPESEKSAVASWNPGAMIRAPENPFEHARQADTHDMAHQVLQLLAWLRPRPVCDVDVALVSGERVPPAHRCDPEDRWFKSGNAFPVPGPGPCLRQDQLFSVELGEPSGSALRVLGGPGRQTPEATRNKRKTGGLLAVPIAAVQHLHARLPEDAGNRPLRGIAVSIAAGPLVGSFALECPEWCDHEIACSLKMIKPSSGEWPR